MRSKRILIVEDDPFVANVLACSLQETGYKILRAADGQSGLAVARIERPDLVILDVLLPVIDGCEVCRRLRADSRTRDVLILIVSGRSSEADQLLGFRAGADDYVTKPFSTKVMLERVKAVMRRPHFENRNGEIITSQGITVDRLRHRVLADRCSLDVTLSEFSLLEVLIRQPGRAFTRAELINAALGDSIVMERTIDVHILALRRKLGRHGRLIETVRGIGYRFREPLPYPHTFADMPSPDPNASPVVATRREQQLDSACQ